MSMEQLTCEQRIDAEFASTIEDIEGMGVGSDEFMDYFLGFDFVEEGTFGDQTEPYYRAQISWGGPSDEFRFYEDRTDYVFMDWFDGGVRDVTDHETVRDVRAFFEACIGIDFEHRSGSHF